MCVCVWSDEMQMVDHEDQLRYWNIQVHTSSPCTVQSFRKTTRKEEITAGSAAGETTVLGAWDRYMLSLLLAQVPKIGRRIFIKITPWHAEVPPGCFHCLAILLALGKTSVATTKQETYHCHCNNCRDMYFLQPFEDIRSWWFHCC